MSSPPVSASSLDALQACYVRNLEALYAADPTLARQVDALPFASLPALEPTRDGRLTLRIVADNGKPLYVHSKYRPLEETRTQLDQQLQRPDDAEGGAAPEDALDTQCFLLCGIGLGYHVAELEARFEHSLFIIAEDDLTLVKAALCVTDLSAILQAQRITFLVSDNKHELHDRLRPVMTPLMLGLRIVKLPHVTRYHAAFHNRVHERLRDFVTFGRLQVVSLIRNARETCRSAAFNLPSYLGHPGVEVLADRARGYPAILVAAGPSLARNVDQLAALRDRAVIIAAQTVLKTLLARGIVPHFVTTLDFHEISAQFFQGVDDFHGTTLVAEPKVHYKVLDTFRGRRHVLRSTFIGDLLRAAAPERGGLRAGSTVAHLSFYLAEHLGCDPIILVGQDLSFSDGLYYPAGMPIEHVWWPELSRFLTVEMKQWERIVRARAGLRRVKDIHGREVYTDDQLFTYAEQFEADFAATKARVIQASEGGRMLAGTAVLALRDAAERYCVRPLPDGLFPEVPPADVAELKARAARELEQRIAELTEIRRISHETRELLEQMDGLLRKPAEFNRRVARVDELRAQMRRMDRSYTLVSHVSQLAELRRVQADRAIRDTGPETPERAGRRLRRDREYVTAFLDGCDFLLRMLPEALQRLREQL